MLYALRDYQRESIDAAHHDWRALSRLAILLPTGAGKTVITAHFVKEEADAEPSARILVVVHRQEILDATVEKIREVNPGLSVGIEKADEHHSSPNDDVVVASIHTIGRSALRRATMGRFDLIIVDECHHACAKSYMETLADFGSFGRHVAPDGTRSGACVRTVGVTATLTRNDELGLGDVWQKVTYRKSLEWMVERGYLVPHTNMEIVVPDLRLEEISMIHSDEEDEPDYSGSQLGAALVNADAGRILAQAYLDHATDESGEIRRGVVFTPTKGAARHVLEAFALKNIPAELITGDTPSMCRQRRAAQKAGEPVDHRSCCGQCRKSIFERVIEGITRVIINVMVLTEGFDLPPLEVAVIARPTKSQGLYVQMVGRVLRTWLGKTCALVLDMVGVTSQLPMNTVADLKRTGTKPPTGRPAPSGPPTRREPSVRRRPAPVPASISGLLAPRKSADYTGKVRGVVVEVWRDGVLIKKAKAKRPEDAPRLAQLLIKQDQLSRGR